MTVSYNVDIITDRGEWQTVQVVTSSGPFAARRQAEKMAGGRSYNVTKIRDYSATGYLADRDKDSSPAQMPNVGGSGALLGLLTVLVALVWALPWVMAIGGVFGGHWVLSKITGKTLGQAMDEDKVKLVAFMVITCTLLGTTGYVKGTEWKQQLNSDSVPEQIAEPTTK